MKSKILVVDDSNYIRAVTAKILKANGFDVLEAVDGEDGVNKAKEHLPHLILCDIEMPKADGYDVFAALQNDDNTDTIPFIFLTVRATKLDIRHGMELGADDYLTKPFTADELITTVTTRLEKRSKIIHHLEETEPAPNIELSKICNGSFLLTIPKANIAWIFNPWPDITKFLIQKEVSFNGVVYPDLTMQKGVSCNLIEFPLLHAMFVQGMIFRGEKPTLVGTQHQIELSSGSFKRGLYGLYDTSEMEGCDLSQYEMDALMKEIKGLSIGGTLKEMDELLEFVPLAAIEDNPTINEATNYNGAKIWKKGINVFGVEWEGETIEIDCNLGEEETYIPPLDIDMKDVPYTLYQIIDTGEEDGFSPKSCMHTVIQWRDKIICVDLPMNTSYLLNKVSLSKTEIDAVVFTHNHDDHIGDISLLLQMGKKVTVICPKIVWKTILLKASKMLDMSIEELSSYFDYRPIRYGEEYDYAGLRILAHPSIHPVPCAIYRFRGIVDQEWKTYGHMSDILNFTRGQMLVDEGHITQERFDRYREFVLQPTDVKKVDVGAKTGTEKFAVHGSWRDFLNDKSDHIVLAHINQQHLEDDATVLVGQFAIAGSARSMTARSAATYQDKYRERAVTYLRRYIFNLLDDDNMADSVLREQVMAYTSILADNETQLIQPNTPFWKMGSESKFVDMVIGGIAGVWEKNNGGLKRVVTLQAGDFIGSFRALHQSRRERTIRSETYVRILRMPSALFREVASLFGLYNSDGSGIMQRVWDNRLVVMDSRTLGGEIPVYLQNRVAQHGTKVSLKKGDTFLDDGDDSIFIGDHRKNFAICIGDHRLTEKFTVDPVFGEYNFTDNGIEENLRYHVEVLEDTSVLKLEPEGFAWMRQKPVFRLNMKELETKRRIHLERMLHGGK